MSTPTKPLRELDLSLVVEEVRTVLRSGWIPRLYAGAVFLAGAVLLASGAMPAASSRLAWISKIVPLDVIELSHFLGSLAGVALLLLARGLLRRSDAAWWGSFSLLLVGGVVSFTRGGSWVQSGLMVALALALLPSRRRFDRRASLLSIRWSAAWTIGVGAVLAATLWLVTFSYRHVEYSEALWWKFAVNESAPRSLRALVGVVSLLFVFGLARLFRSRPAEPHPPTDDELEAAAPLVRSSREVTAHFVFLRDKTILFSPDRSAFLMYAIEGRSWVCLGEPVGPEDRHEELLWTFADLARTHDGWPVFYRLREETLHRYVDLGVSFYKLGEEGRIPLEGFTLEGGGRKDLRQAKNRAEKEGAVFEIVAAEDVPPLLGDLRRISDAWLRDKNAGEKGFSLGFFDDAYLVRGPVAVVRRDGEPVAFANVLASGQREELTVDLMRYDEGAPKGVMDFLFAHLMLWGAAQGYRWFGLGMAPLAGLEDRAGADLWNRLGMIVFRHGEHFYNFQGLRSYKEKYQPVWRPRFLAAPSGIVLPQALANVTTLIGGGIAGTLRR